jgi:hypothetical protein
MLFTFIGFFFSSHLALATTPTQSLRLDGFTAFQGHFNPIPVLNAHEVYYSANFQSRVFLRFNLPEGKTQSPEGEFLNLIDEDYLVYLRDKTGTRYALIFSNVDPAARVRLKNQIESKFKQAPPLIESVSNWLIPNTNAESSSSSCALNGTLIPTHIAGSVKALSEQEETQALFKVLSGCTSGFFQGLWDASGGMVTGIAKGAYGLVTDPIGSWRSMKSGFEHAYEFIRHFQTSMKRLGAAFLKMPLESKAELLCSFITSIGAGIALTIFTAGAGAGELAAQVSSFINRISKLSEFLSYFSKLGNLKAVLGERFLSVFAKGGITAERLETIETFTHKGIPELAKQAALCGI